MKRFNMKISPVTIIPKKINLAIARLSIKGVVGGYIGVVGGYMTKSESKMNFRAIFTCWDSSGNPVCLLYKDRGMENWELFDKNLFTKR
jgi:hypothetical protein